MTGLTPEQQERLAAALRHGCALPPPAGWAAWRSGHQATTTRTGGPGEPVRQPGPVAR